MNKLYAFCAVGLLAFSNLCLADNGLPLAARQEVMRRGAMVEHVSGYEAAAPLFAEAVKPPADDSFKWYLTVFTAPKCGPCDSLKKAFRSDETLKAWANVDSPKDSCVHYAETSVTDITQEWRRKHAPALVSLLDANREKGFPIVVIQPPLNGEYGNPSTCLPPIIGFSSASDLAYKIRETTRLYVEAYDSGNKSKPNPDRSPPFPLVDEQKKTPPADQPKVQTMNAVESLINWLMSNPQMTAGLIALALYWFRKEIVAMGLKTAFSDAKFARLMAVIKEPDSQ
jgi:hypothetical protein